MALTTLFFDVGGTLMLPDLDRMMREVMARGIRPTADQLRRADMAAKNLPAPPAADDSPTNPIFWRVYFWTLLGELGQRDLFETIAPRAADSSHWSLPAPHAAEILTALKKKYRLAVISNADGHIDQVLERGGLLHFFESITDSDAVQLYKPDRRIFDLALSRMGASAEESMYIGDVYEIDYVGATGAGMDAVLIDHDGVYRGFHNGVPRVESLPELAQRLNG